MTNGFFLLFKYHDFEFVFFNNHVYLVDTINQTRYKLIFDIPAELTPFTMIIDDTWKKQ